MCEEQDFAISGLVTLGGPWLVKFQISIMGYKIFYLSNCIKCTEVNYFNLMSYLVKIIEYR